MIGAYEKALNSINELVKEFKSLNGKEINEATTRLRFIDTILLDCLGWAKTDITAEDSFAGEYSDYTIHLTRPVAILEAKKTGIYFEVPIGIKKLIHPIKTICKNNESIEKALLQVSAYCHKRGIQIGIVSNGW